MAGSSDSLYILSVDATNAFNLIKRSSMFDLIHKRVPELYLTAYNTYGNSSYSVIKDEIVNVEEGSTMGCPLAATFFNLSLLPLDGELGEQTQGTLFFYMDDGYCVGNKEQVVEFWNKLNQLGRKVGYYPNNKSKVFGKSLQKDDVLWKNIGLKAMNRGLDALGAPIGAEEYIENSARSFFNNIAEIVKCLGKLANIYLQHALGIMLKSTQHKATHPCHTLKDAWKYSSEYDASLNCLLNTLFN